MKCPLASNQEL